MNKTFFLTGQCGSGKDSYLTTVAKTCRALHAIGISELLKTHLETKPFMEKGILVPDDIVFSCLQKTNIDNTCINGFPRTKNQLQFLQELQKTRDICIIIFDIDDNIAKNRMLKRGRFDDTEEVVTKRLQQFRNFVPYLLGEHKIYTIYLKIPNQTKEETEKFIKEQLEKSIYLIPT